jgi:hypothetical protein
LPYLRSAFWSARFQFGKASLQPHRVKLIDGECSDAALRASRTTNQPIPAPTRRIGKSGIDNLDQFLITGGWETGSHTDEDSASSEFKSQRSRKHNRHQLRD